MSRGNYGFRNYDPQIARFTQLDPLTWDYPELTNYQYAGDEPIANVDMDGLEALPSIINPLTWFNLPQMLDPVVITAKLPAAAARTGETVGSIASGMASFVNLGVQQMGRGIDNTFVRQSPQTVERVGNALQSAGHRNIQVPGQQVMEPISWLDRLSGQRSLSIDDGTGNMIDVEVDDEGRLTNKMGLTKFEVPFVPDRAPFSITKFLKGIFKSGGAAKTGANLTKSQLKSISSLEGQIATHQTKLAEYIKNPMKFDNKGFLKNAPNDAVRQKIIQSRIIHLQQEIQTFQNNIQKIINGQ